MIFNNKIEQRLGLRYFSGGAGSSSGTTTPQMTPQQFIEAYNQYLPQMLGTMNNAAVGTTQAQAQAAAQANPIYTQSTLNQMNNLGGQYQQAGANLANQQAASTANLLQGSGGQAAMAAYNLNNALNPVQATANRQAVNLLNSYNTQGLSPGEYNATERSVNQSNQMTGNLGVGNGMNTISNAMNFGGAFNNKLAGLSNALGSATNVANAQNSQFNPVNTAIGAGNTQSNFGLSQFNPSQAVASSNTPYSAASALGNQLAGVASASKGTTSSGNASGGCFLTTAICEYKGLPDNCHELTTLRRFRDTEVPTHKVREYYEIAPAIVNKIKNDAEALEYVWDVVQKCVTLIDRRRHSEAMVAYENMVNKLK